MFKVNEYFNGNVKSISFSTPEGPASAGVMAPGEYEFGTSQKEFMTVTCGSMLVKLPDNSDWKDFKQGETFIVEANKKFQLKIKADVSYICLYR
jgi:purine/pyrimidine-nucleoside phosphorylase